MHETIQNDALEEAIARNAAAVLSLPAAEMVRHHRSRFIGRDEGGIWVAAVPAERRLIEALIAGGQPAGISFRTRTVRASFATPLQKYEPDYRLNPQASGEAVLLRFPDKILALQRRRNYRPTVPESAGLTVRIWRMGRHAALDDEPVAAREVLATVRDISIGGIGMILRGQDDQPPRISLADRLRIQLRMGDISLLLEGHLRYPDEPLQTSTVRAGIQFQDLQQSFEGRRTEAILGQIVSELERAEIRRHREAARTVHQ